MSKPMITRAKFIGLLLSLGLLVVLFNVQNVSQSSQAQEPQITPWPTTALAGQPRLDYLKSEGFNWRNLAWSPDSLLLAVGGVDGIYLFNEDFAPITHWPYQPLIRALSWSPDGLYLASASWDETIWVWEVASGQVVHIQTAIPCRPRTLAWHPFEDLVAVGTQCGEIHLFDPFVGQISQKIKHVEGQWTVNLAWHPLGDFLVFAEIGRYKAWEPKADEALWSVDDPYANPSEYAEIVKVSISPDGATLASGGFYLRLWNARTGELLQTLANLPGLVAGLDWSADGRRIAVHTMDASIHIYEMTTSEPLQSYPVGIQLVGNEDVTDILDMENTLDWSPDGSKLATITDGSRVFIWDMETYYLLAILEWPVEGGE